ncbi:uncharacterized protein ARMOST_18282 [Armillaria ostoyae]|uniref:Uncharacterized protein n=1 Tax=Armillaria ostoyae TaxID=47428 RepID=A0A284S1B7_ARMOS|nr:uncharacterized protein ARMOST_18282 [Armillaria ostoyae]
MSSTVIKDTIIGEPVNGMVSDAAHGWWRKRTSLLIVTSTYSTILMCWVPALFSYSNGASKEHYMHHFYALFKLMAKQAEKTNTELTDEILAQVVDFSEAERSGYILAFAKFRCKQGDSRTQDQLLADGAKLLKGCEQHFHNAVTRIKRISSIIPVEDEKKFKKLALKLCSVLNQEGFEAIAHRIVKKWPRTSTWLAWWTRESHASMIFKSQQIMDAEVWDSIPGSTNAEEAMHWKLYSGAGHNHDVIEGFEGLLSMADYYERLNDAALIGSPTRYGHAEPWKLYAETIGRTKPSRAPQLIVSCRKKNDGRPPDTRQQLHRANSKKSHVQFEDNLKHLVPQKLLPPQPGYPWSNNSCWLDSSLMALSAALAPHWPLFSSIFRRSNESNPPLLHSLHLVLDSLRALASPSDASLNQSTLLAKRDRFRMILWKNNILYGDIHDPQLTMSWLSDVVSRQFIGSDITIQSLFCGLYITVQTCQGSQDRSQHNPQSTFSHVHVQRPRKATLFHLPASVEEATRFGGCIEAWFRELTQVNQAGHNQDACWHNKDGVSSCSGKPQLLEFYVSLPIILTISVDDRDSKQWDFPASFTPTSLKDDHDSGIIYDIVARIFLVNGNHFQTRYVTPTLDGKDCAIYVYDGMKNKGYATHEQKATLATHMTGGEVINRPEKSSRTQAVIYQLRGGRIAQKAFLEAQLGIAERVHGLSFDSHDISIIPDIAFTRHGYQELTNEQIWWQSTDFQKIREYSSSQIPDESDHTLSDMPEQSKQSRK